MALPIPQYAEAPDVFDHQATPTTLERKVHELKGGLLPLLSEVKETRTRFASVIRLVKRLPDRIKSYEEETWRDDIDHCYELYEKLKNAAVIFELPPASPAYHARKDTNRFNQSAARKMGRVIPFGKSKNEDDSKSTQNTPSESATETSETSETSTPEDSEVIDQVTVAGETFKITPKLLACFKRFPKSIGTPPTSPRILQQTEQSVWGIPLSELARFRYIFGRDAVHYDRLMSLLDDLHTQRSRYALPGDEKAFMEATRKFPELAGLKPLLSHAAVFTTSADGIVDLLKRRVLSRMAEDTKEKSLEVVKGAQLNREFLAQMKANPTKTYVAVVEDVPESVLSDQSYEEWRGVLNRLVIIENPKDAQTANACMVYSLVYSNGNIRLVDSLKEYYTKENGAASTPQLNFRLMLRQLQPRQLDRMLSKISERKQQLKRKAKIDKPTHMVRTEDWTMNSRRDYLALKKLERFLKFLKRAKTDPNFQDEVMRMRKDHAALVKKYRHGGLGDDWEYASVPEGGGRLAIGVFRDRFLQGIKKQVDAVAVSIKDQNNPQNLEQRLKSIKDQKARETGVDGYRFSEGLGDHGRRYNEGIFANDSDKARRAKETEHGPLSSMLLAKAASAAYSVPKAAQGAVECARSRVAATLEGSYTGRARALLDRVLRQAHASTAGKPTERGRFREAAERLKGAQAAAAGLAGAAASKAAGVLEKFKTPLETGTPDVDEIQIMIEQLKHGTFRPRLALGKFSWSYPDILDGQTFDLKKNLTIDQDKNGTLDARSLELQLEEERRRLKGFPELFKVRCKSTILILSFGNPTAHMADLREKMEIFRIASKYGLPVIIDDPYHLLVSAHQKLVEGDKSFDQLFQILNGKFEGPGIPMAGVVDTFTKGEASGGRTSVNFFYDRDREESEQSFGDYVQERVPGTHAMAVYVDNDVERQSILTKDVCKALDTQLLQPVSWQRSVESFRQFLDDPTKIPDETAQQLRKWIDKLPKEGTLSALATAISTLPIKKSANSARHFIDSLNTYVYKHYASVLDTTIRKFFDESEDAIVEEGVEPKKGLESDHFASPIYSEVVKVRNTLDRLRCMGASVGDYVDFMNTSISDLKGLRVSKLVQREAQKRAKTVEVELKKLSQEDSRYKNIVDRCIQPQGAFYLFYQLDETAADEDFAEFVKYARRGINTSVLSWNDGYVRFAFGGNINTQEGYSLQARSIINDLKLITDCWEIFKKYRRNLPEETPNRSDVAFRKLFGDQDVNLARVVEMHQDLNKDLIASKELDPALPRALSFSPELSRYVSKAAPDATSLMININEFSCLDGHDTNVRLENFTNSKVFQRIYDFFLLKHLEEIEDPHLQELTPREVVSRYGAESLASKMPLGERDWSRGERDVFSKIAKRVAESWLSPQTIRILRHDAKEFKTLDEQEMYLSGKAKQIGELIFLLLKALGIPDDEISTLLPRDPASNFHLGYSTMGNVTADETEPAWSSCMIEKGRFITAVSRTSLSSDRTTPGEVRSAAEDFALKPRDKVELTDHSPDASYFQDRLREFAEVLDSRDYAFKLVQNGPVRELLIIHRTYEDNLQEVDRIFPRVADLSPADLQNVKPDGIHLVGVPAKVMGEQYKQGYFTETIDRKEIMEDGTELTRPTKRPIAWLSQEFIEAHYYGNAKKPLMLIHNMVARERGGWGAHGALFVLKIKGLGLVPFGDMGDSGTGKSEKLMALLTAVIENGGRDYIEDIFILTPDMYTVWFAEDGLYASVISEDGDYGRPKDAPQSYRDRYPEIFAAASSSNAEATSNGRMGFSGTVSGLDKVPPFIKLWGLVDSLNFERPGVDGAAAEVIEPHEWMVKGMIKAFRREKGTSQDRTLPSTAFPKALRDRYGSDINLLLPWNLETSTKGRVSRSVLSFSEHPDQCGRAHQIVKEGFTDREFNYNGKKWKVVKTYHRPFYKEGEDRRINEYFLDIQEVGADGKLAGEVISTPFYENILRTFAEDLSNTPITSTPMGNPFDDQRFWPEPLQRLSHALTEHGIITMDVRTGLAVKDWLHKGPGTVAEAFTSGAMFDRGGFHDKIIGEYRPQVDADLRARYGNVLPSTIPDWIMGENLSLYTVPPPPKFHDAQGNVVKMKWNGYDSDTARDSSQPYHPECFLLTDELAQTVRDICTDRDENETFDYSSYDPNISAYTGVIDYYAPSETMDPPEELIYQILLHSTTCSLTIEDDPRSAAEKLKNEKEEVMRAKCIAEKMSN